MRFIKAVKIFDGAHFLPADAVLVLKDGQLMEVTREEHVGSGQVELLDGIITPGFVNAHCHLELSHLRGKLRRDTGFCEFALELMAIRYSEPLQVRHAAMQEAAGEMRTNGIVAVGDISNNNESFEIKRNFPGLYFHTFIELLSLNPAAAKNVFQEGLSLLLQLRSAGLSGSLAPHAPYSIAPELLSMIVSYNTSEDLPMSIHSQETMEETKFFKGELCGMHRLYRELGVDISFFKPTNTSSIAHILPLLKGTKTVLVHNTYSTKDDIDQAAHQNISWCLCPGANKYIESGTPPYGLFKDHARRICVGTDSLASNESLDVLAELNEIASAAPFFSEEQLLAMVTSNGAEALGIADRFGHLTAGTSPGLNLLRRNGTGFELLRTIA